MSAAAIGDWRENAACAGHDPELWFNDNGRPPSESPATAICRRCPVRAECLEIGMGETYGVWGGLTSYQRSRLRRRKGMVHAEGAARRLRALAVVGWSTGEIAAHMSEPLSPWQVARIRSGHSVFITYATAAAVKAAYRRLSNSRPDPDSKSARFVRASVRQHNWAPPEAWIGRNIDDPRAVPRPTRRRAA